MFVEFEHNQTVSRDDKMNADNETWKNFNHTAAHIFGVDVRLVPKHYRQWIHHHHGGDEWRILNFDVNVDPKRSFVKLLPLPDLLPVNPTGSNRDVKQVKSQVQN